MNIISTNSHIKQIEYNQLHSSVTFDAYKPVKWITAKIEEYLKSESQLGIIILDEITPATDKRKFVHFSYDFDRNNKRAGLHRVQIIYSNSIPFRIIKNFVSIAGHRVDKTLIKQTIYNKNARLIQYIYNKYTPDSKKKYDQEIFFGKLNKKRSGRSKITVYFEGETYSILPETIANLDFQKGAIPDYWTVTTKSVKTSSEEYRESILHTHKKSYFKNRDGKKITYSFRQNTRCEVHLCFTRAVSTKKSIDGYKKILPYISLFFYMAEIQSSKMRAVQNKKDKLSASSLIHLLETYNQFLLLHSKTILHSVNEAIYSKEISSHEEFINIVQILPKIKNILLKTQAYNKIVSYILHNSSIENSAISKRSQPLFESAQYNKNRLNVLQRSSHFIKHITIKTSNHAIVHVENIIDILQNLICIMIDCNEDIVVNIQNRFQKKFSNKNLSNGITAIVNHFEKKYKFIINRNRFNEDNIVHLYKFLIRASIEDFYKRGHPKVKKESDIINRYNLLYRVEEDSVEILREDYISYSKLFSTLYSQLSSTTVFQKYELVKELPLSILLFSYLGIVADSKQEDIFQLFQEIERRMRRNSLQNEEQTELALLMLFLQSGEYKSELRKESFEKYETVTNTLFHPYPLSFIFDDECNDPGFLIFEECTQKIKDRCSIYAFTQLIDYEWPNKWKEIQQEEANQDLLAGKNFILTHFFTTWGEEIRRFPNATSQALFDKENLERNPIQNLIFSYFICDKLIHICTDPPQKLQNEKNRYFNQIKNRLNDPTRVTKNDLDELLFLTFFIKELRLDQSSQEIQEMVQFFENVARQ